jgi:hypothetical protein
MTIMSKPGNEKMVENASEALNFKTLLSTKSDNEHLTIFQVLFGDINGDMVMHMINHT